MAIQAMASNAWFMSGPPVHNDNACPTALEVPWQQVEGVSAAPVKVPGRSCSIAVVDVSAGARGWQCFEW